jgi:hypothetical protein
MQIREIDYADLGAVRGLLVEGFPVRSRRYWEAGLSHLRTRPLVSTFPRYGYLMEADGDVQGIILAITSHSRVGVRTNLSSWYVREGYRQFATFLLRHALRLKGTTFLNVSPSEHVLPIMTAFGFEPYTAGTAVLDVRTSIGRTSTKVTVRRITPAQCSDLPEASAEVAKRHLGYGCSGLWLEAGQRSGLLIHRRKWIKRAIPSEQVVYADPELLADAAAPVMRALLLRGSTLALVDVGGESPPFGRFVARGRRFARGQPVPAPGDLLESELAIFGP